LPVDSVIARCGRAFRAVTLAGMQTAVPVPVVALPGGVMPAAVRYASLAEAVAGQADLHVKDLEVYAGDATPPPGYSIEREVEAVARFADGLGLDRFHLLGYSGGGFVSLAFAGTHPDRLLSLALFEPAGVPGRRGPEEAQYTGRLSAALAGLDGPDFLAVFTRLQVREGVEVPPPAGPPPPWMRTRPAGLAALMTAFERYPFDRALLRGCRFPVFLGYGDQTGAYEEAKVAVLARLLPDLHLHRFTGVHHFVPPEQIYTAGHVAELRRLWTGAAVPAPAR
jgi:pimeloyl-ACP methyl ester carboxylesterase